jgi:hypothetical protein
MNHKNKNLSSFYSYLTFASACCLCTVTCVHLASGKPNVALKQAEAYFYYLFPVLIMATAVRRAFVILIFRTLATRLSGYRCQESVALCYCCPLRQSEGAKGKSLRQEQK